MVPINDRTAFVVNENKLVSIEEATGMELELAKIRRKYARHVGEDELHKLVPVFARDEDPVLYHTTVEYVLQTVKKYLDIVAEEKYDDKYDKKWALKDTARDMYKSELLERMLSGLEPQKNSPPKSYGHCWYDLVEKGEDFCVDVWFRSTYSCNNKGKLRLKEVGIDGETWYIKEEIDEENYIVIWPKDDKIEYKLNKMTKEDFDRLLHSRLWNKRTKDKYSWKLTRMEKDG